ncbi:MAG TPA: NAD(P)/FAD-dependent oxidoreductase [Thermoanaerobaculia bacterium]
MQYDAVVIGAGPNGLAAAIALAQRNLSVLVFEANSRIGGGARTEELTLPGFRNDVCSAIHPMAASSPFFRSLPLASYGLEWIRPPFPYAHPFDDGTAAAPRESLDETMAVLREDGQQYVDLMRPFVRQRDAFFDDVLRPPHIPRHPLLLMRFGLRGRRSAASLSSRFRSEAARSLIAGPAIHAAVPLTQAVSSALGLVMIVAAHTVGWPLARGGSQSITDALAAYLRSLGGVFETSRRVESLEDLPDARAYLFDITPRQLLRIAGDHLPSLYKRRLQRFRYGPGVFKIDYALDGPIPWRAEPCTQTATVHLGGTLEEMVDAEARVARGEHPPRPFVIVTQPSLFDVSRAPSGKHTAWVYCHVPNSSIVDMTAAIEQQIERFAPGFRPRVLARNARGPRDLERENANLVGGDIAGGLTDWSQLFMRPIARLDPYSTPNEKIFLCSSSTPPGGAVHGMCGYWAAQSVLRRVFKRA